METSKVKVMSRVSYPLTFALHNPHLEPAIKHLQETNPGYTVDYLDPAFPLLVPICACGETELITMDELDFDDGTSSVQYTCKTCGIKTPLVSTRPEAVQLWAQLQLNKEEK